MKIEILGNGGAFSPETTSFLVNNNIMIDCGYILTKNYINIENEDSLKNKLDKINSLDKIELKQYHKELRKSGRDKHNRGAGLGLLEMAKKSSEKLKYNFIKVNKNKLLFEITTYI